MCQSQTWMGVLSLAEKPVPLIPPVRLWKVLVAETIPPHVVAGPTQLLVGLYPALQRHWLQLAGLR